MALQTSVTINPVRFSAGLDYTGPGQASTTVSLTLETTFVSPGTTELPGRFVMFSVTDPTSSCKVMEAAAEVNTVAGVVVNDKFNQRAPSNLGGEVYYNQGDNLDVMMQGWVVVETNGTFDPAGDLYINNSTSSEVRGKIQNSSTDGLLVGGPSYAPGGAGAFVTTPVRAFSDAENGLALFKLNF